ncbi:MAG: trimethylamine methyltransferase family protein [Clostridiales bacterium]
MFIMKPRYQILTQTDIEKIHETSLRIMENVGVVFSYEPARELLAKHGAKVEGHTVFFPATMVEEKLKSVPSSFRLCGRNPEKDVEINTENTCYAGPYGSPYVQDLDNGRRYGNLQDFINIVKLVNDLPNIDIQSHISCEPNDVDVDTRHNVMTYNNLKYSDKPLMGSVLGYDAAKQSIEMAAIAHGGLDVLNEKTIIASIPCTLTPLSYDDKMAGAIMAYAEFNQAQLVNSLSISGATTPATFAGTVALQNAEVLAGIIFAQCVNPGCPIVYSASGSNAEMSNGALAIGSPEDAIFSLMNGQLAKFYNIPCRISGTLSDSKMMDSQAAFESAITGMMAQLAGGNFILHSAGIIETYNCTSFEKLMIDHEMLGYFKHIGRGVEVNEDTLAYDAIAEVGPQGQFLTSDHTFAHFRKTFYRPFITDRQNAQQWKGNGGCSLEQKANKQWKQMLADYVEPTLPADIDAALKKYVEQH